MRRSTEIGSVGFRDCFRKPMSGSLACRSPSEPGGSMRTLDADHEHNCCIPFASNEDKWV